MEPMFTATSRAVVPAGCPVQRVRSGFELARMPQIPEVGSSSGTSLADNAERRVRAALRVPGQPIKAAEGNQHVDRIPGSILFVINSAGTK